MHVQLENGAPGHHVVKVVAKEPGLGSHNHSNLEVLECTAQANKLTMNYATHNPAELMGNGQPGPRGQPVQLQPEEVWPTVRGHAQILPLQAEEKNALDMIRNRNCVTLSPAHVQPHLLEYLTVRKDAPGHAETSGMRHIVLRMKVVLTSAAVHLAK